MDKNSEDIETFESFLKQTTSLEHSGLYKGNTQINKSDETSTTSLTAREVISNVIKQIKGLQGADCSKNYKKSTINLSKHNKPSLVALSELQDRDKAPPPEAKFESHQITDTQLIDVLQHAEALDVQTGFTEEFHNTFCQRMEDQASTSKQNIHKPDPVFPILDISLKEPDPNKDNNDTKLSDDEDIFKDDYENTKTETVNNIKNIREEYTQFDNYTQILNECIEIENMEQINTDENDFKDEDIEEPSSPVFEVKNSKTKSNSPSPLIFNLDTYETFENIAIPIINTTPDKEDAKRKINSQIIGKELFIQTNIVPFLIEMDRESPVIEMNNEVLTVNKAELAEYTQKELLRNSEPDSNVDTNDKELAADKNRLNGKSMFEDEILFSSDEEDDNAIKYCNDLPFTCALETSFYDQEEILDKTMYVGFQTASNKSIIVDTQSFHKAKSFLEDSDEDPSVKGLLDDSNSNSNTQNDKDNEIIKSITNMTENDFAKREEKIEQSVPSCFDMCFEDIKNVEEFIDRKESNKDSSQDKIQIHIEEDNSKTIVKKEIEVRKMDGFKTASDKHILISDKALANTKNIFHDIDMATENDGTEFENSNENFKAEIVDKCKETVDIEMDAEVHKLDEDLIKEFQEDIHMEFEMEFNPTSPPKTADVVGFKTASNKNIHVSDEALAKTKRIFDNIDSDENITAGISETKSLTEQTEYHKRKNTIIQNKSKSVVNKAMMGFKTASNKNITISDKTMLRTKSIFENINLSDDFEETSRTTEKITKENMRSNQLQHFLGFKTASNKEIVISEEALSKTCKVFEDTDNESNNDPPKRLTRSRSLAIQSLNASNKRVCLSAEAPSGTKKFKDLDIDDTSCDLDKDIGSPFQGFTDTDDGVKETLVRSQKIVEKLSKEIEEEEFPDIDNDVDTCIEQPFLGCTTASNKPINVSAEALAKYKNILAELEDRDESDFFGISSSSKNIKGFTTASNKEVVISETALAKSKKIFQDLDISPNIDSRKKDRNIAVQGFQTASNKKVEVSETALANSRRLFNDLSIFEDTATVSKNQVNELKFNGFKTASNKEVKISAEALAKTKNIFQDINDAEISDNPYSNPAKKFQGFQTASNKRVSVSEEALAKSRKIFQDVDDFDTKLDNKLSHTDSSLKFGGFQTANNKAVKVSEEALAKSRELFRNIDAETNSDLEKAKTNANAGLKFEGFQTGSNKKVNISEDALAKSEKLFQDLDDEENSKMKAGCSSNVAANSKFVGFQTASNKKVSVSEEVLAKSKKIFQGLDVGENFELKDNSSNEEKMNSKFIGFHTASNQKVSISEEAFAKSKKLFQDLDVQDDSKINNDGSIDKQANSKFGGFQTASNKKVSISEEALAKSKKLFQDIDIDHNINNGDSNNIQINSKFEGFQTASNKKVIVSEDALAKSKKLFDDIDKTENITIDEKSKSISKANSNFSFNTANNNKVGVSKKALEKAKQLFAEKELKVNKVAQNMEKVSKLELPSNSNKEMIENMIDTQVFNNFQTTLLPEDFAKEKSIESSKRSGSPILSCPKSKKRKIFQIPYSQKCVKKLEIDSKLEDKLNDVTKYDFSTNYKKDKKYTLEDVKRLEEASTNEIQVDAYIHNFNYENLLDFEFSGSRNDYTDTVITSNDLKNTFLDSANKKLVPEGWLDIHLKQIIWKLLSYEIKFPKTMFHTCTVRNVLDQLKYRYEKELYNAERSALRKIMEKDDTSSRSMVLCVVSVFDVNNTIELLLSDGWYTIRTVIDKMLSDLVKRGRIQIGTKLFTNGAEMLGAEQAVSPWEDTTQLRLKLSGNSTRRARWHSRLGFHSAAAILCQLSDLTVTGGRAGRLRAYVTRVYPALYVHKFADGSTVTRSERLELQYQMKYESERQTTLEKIYEEVEKEIQEQDSQDSEGSQTGVKRKALDSGSQIAKLMKSSKDPAELRSTLTSTQIALLDDHNTKKRESLLQTIQERVQDKMAALGLNERRNVVTLLKARVASVEERNGTVSVTKGMLSIWKPNDVVVEMIKEDSWIDVMNVMPTALRYSEIQLSAGRQSVFSQSKYKESDKIKPYLVTLKRTCYPIKDLVRNPAMTTNYNELDTGGIIFQIDPQTNEYDPKKHQFQNIFLSDEDKNIISINFWGGMKKFGFENVLECGEIVGCVNLQKRAGNTKKNIPQFRVTEFTYFTKTPKHESIRKVVEELSQKLAKIDKKVFIQDCINAKNKSYIKVPMSENISPYRFPQIDFNNSKIKTFLDSPLPQKSNKVNDNLNLTGLDFDSTFKQTDTEELSPKTLLRKRQVKQRIAKLKMYGEPPPLSPIQMINKSKNAASAYKSPLISKSDVSPSVASNERIKPNRTETATSKTDEENIVSPVICLNRTYVKRSANPTKINFSKNENSVSEVIDEFGEEFDCSPPLSLD